jgi:hypothetical protein
LIRHFDVVHKFLEVLKDIEFSLKTQSGKPLVVTKMFVPSENKPKIYISSP